MEPIRAQHPPLSILISGPAAAHHAAVSAGMHNVPARIPSPVHPVHPNTLHGSELLTKLEESAATEHVGPHCSYSLFRANQVLACCMRLGRLDPTCLNACPTRGFF